MRRLTLALLTLLFSQLLCSAQAFGPAPFQSPAVSRTHVAFVYAGELWTVERAGGEARRLDTGRGRKSDPAFSPDGALLAFAKDGPGGNVDVYVMPSAGGDARRLTFHPRTDTPLGWSPNGRAVLFRSQRASDLGPRLYTVPAAGGFETELPFPIAVSGSFSPDGQSIAYAPYGSRNYGWRNYRGGQTTPVYVARLSDSQLHEIPRANSNDSYPAWVGNTVYFLSDRNGTNNLFAYDVPTKRVRQLTNFEKYDIRSAAAGGDAIVFVQDGRLHLYDLKTNRAGALDVRITRGDFAETKPRKVKAERFMENYTLSPDGSQIIFEARGELLLFDTDKKSARNLTATTSAAERAPAWSPDGRWLAYFSDESGEYQLHVRPAGGEGVVKKISVEPKPSFYFDAVWSPDSKRVAFNDKRLSLWYADVDAGAARRVDSSTFARQGSFQPSWSPDGRWLAYTKNLPNRISAVHLYSIETGKSFQLTDGRLDAENPVFDKNGQFLYFNASANAGASKLQNVSMSAAMAQPATTRRVYLVVLQKDGRSPAVQSKDWEAGAREVRVKGIDTEGIGSRVYPLPIPPYNFADLAAGKPGVLFVLGKWVDIVEGESPPTRVLYKFDVGARKSEKFVEDVREFRVSADGGRVFLPLPRGAFAVVSTDAPPKPDEGRLDVKSLEIEIDPRAEWRQMFDEVWRVQREYFYEPNVHGQNLRALREHYAAFLPQVATRNDLNALFREMLSHMSISHLVVGGGDVPASEEGAGREGTGLLSADFAVEQGRYRVRRIYRGDNSSPSLTAPLAQPGVEVKEGDFLISVDGEEIKAAENLYKYFEGKAGKAVQLKVAADASGAHARTYTVTPMSNENALRDHVWVEGNRQKVREMSGGRLAYIYVPDVGRPGYDAFNRDFYSQLDKQGLIIDQRYNRGGWAADYMIDALRRVPLSAYAFREGDPVPFPAGFIPAPHVMLISEFAGSGGDTLPWMFRKAGLGPLVGRRTIGAGIGGYVNIPGLVDGGFVSAPNRAFYNPQTGALDIENYGTPPDIEVNWTPAEWRAGRDPQLERAVQLALDALKKSPPPRAKTLKYPAHK